MHYDYRALRKQSEQRSQTVRSLNVSRHAAENCDACRRSAVKEATARKRRTMRGGHGPYGCVRSAWTRCCGRGRRPTRGALCAHGPARGVIVPFTLAAVLGSAGGRRVADRLAPETLTRAFGVLLVAVALYVGVRAALGTG